MERQPFSQRDGVVVRAFKCVGEVVCHSRYVLHASTLKDASPN